MDPFLDEQIQATLVLQEAEEILEKRIEDIAGLFRMVAGEGAFNKSFKNILLSTMDLAIKYGRLQSIHEKLLSNESENPKKEA